jgi:hypothetical protein
LARTFLAISKNALNINPSLNLCQYPLNPQANPSSQKTCVILLARLSDKMLILSLPFGSMRSYGGFAVMVLLHDMRTG